MIQRVLVVAVLAGLAAGIAHAAVQLTRVTPLILLAESYENTASPPDDGVERHVYSLLASVLTAIGFGMLLTAAFALHGGSRSGLAGAWYGGWLVSPSSGWRRRSACRRNCPA